MTDVLTRVSAISDNLQDRLARSHLPLTYVLRGELTTPPSDKCYTGLAFFLPSEAHLPVPLAYLRPSYDHRSARNDWLFGYAQDGYAASPRYRTLVDDIATQLAIDHEHQGRLLLHGRAAHIADPFQDNATQPSLSSPRIRAEPPHFGFLLEAAAIGALTARDASMTVHIVSPHHGIPPF
jgi:hypothetical protein